ncbi:uncharacterized protein EV420DRAFT_1579852, partial [Desarmillaria tabescens]
SLPVFSIPPDSWSSPLLCLPFVPTFIFFILESYAVLQASSIILRVRCMPFFLPMVLLFFATF